MALRDALSRSPDIAKLAVLHTMALTSFDRQRVDTCLTIDMREGAANAG